ncbi:MAG: lipopolysaccharide heptosyltransferase II [Candidatus Omnitrophota bacterium]
MRTDRLGEVLLSTVAVDAVKEKYPACGISFVTSAYSRPLLEGRETIERIIETDTFEKKRVFLKAFRLSRVLRKYRFDTAIVLNPHKMLHLACFFAGIPRRIGYARKWGSLLTKTIQDKRDEGLKHEIEYTYDLLDIIGAGGNITGPVLPVAEKEETALNDILSKKGIQDKEPFLVIHPGSSNPAKIWPKEKYKDLIRRIRTELNIKVSILGERKEKAFIDDILIGSDAGVISLAGVLDLRLVAALLKRCSLFIGNDTGPMHIAAATGTPVIAVFRKDAPSTNPVRWRPWGDNHVVFHESGECRAANGSIGHRCMKDVTVDAVFEAVREMVETIDH